MISTFLDDVRDLLHFDPNEPDFYQLHKPVRLNIKRSHQLTDKERSQVEKHSKPERIGYRPLRIVDFMTR